MNATQNLFKLGFSRLAKLILLGLVFLNSISFADPPELIYQPQKDLFGYDLGPDQQLIIEISGSNQIEVWLHDSRVSKFPILLSRLENAWPVNEIILPRPDFARQYGTSQNPQLDAERIVKIEEGESQRLTLKKSGVLTILVDRYLSLHKSELQTMIVPLDFIYQTGAPIDILDGHIPWPDRRWPYGMPYRTYQVVQTHIPGLDKRAYLLQIIDSRPKGNYDAGLFMSLTLFYSSNQVHTVEGDFSNLSSRANMALTFLKPDSILFGNAVKYKVKPPLSENQQVKLTYQFYGNPITPFNEEASQNYQLPEEYSKLMLNMGRFSLSEMNYPNFDIIYLLKEERSAYSGLERVDYENFVFKKKPSIVSKNLKITSKGRGFLSLSRTGILIYIKPSGKEIFLGYFKNNDIIGYTVDSSHLVVIQEDGSRTRYSIRNGKFLEKYQVKEHDCGEALVGLMEVIRVGHNPQLPE